MLTLTTTSKFKKDYKKVQKQGKDMDLLKNVIDTLLKELPLDEKFHDHGLTGNFQGFRECHIQPDWLLIYYADHEKLILTVSRTGSHSELFDM